MLIGVVALVRQRVWPVIGLLASWWVLPVLFFAGTAYQAHRFALTYLPVLLVLLGVGVATAVQLGLEAMRGGPMGKRALYAGIAIVAVVGLAVGAYKEQGSVKGWMAIH